MAKLRRRPCRSGFRRGQERHDRISLGRRSLRSAAGSGGRTRRREMSPSYWRPAGLRRRLRRRPRRRPSRSCFPASSDAVGLGLVQSLSRPGGNITGISHFNVSLAGKRLENHSGADFRQATRSPIWSIRRIRPPQLEVSEASESCRRARFAARGPESEHRGRRSRRPSMRWRDEGRGGMIVASEPFFDSRRDMIVALGGAPRDAG